MVNLNPSEDPSTFCGRIHKFFVIELSVLGTFQRQTVFYVVNQVGVEFLFVLKRAPALGTHSNYFELAPFSSHIKKSLCNSADNPQPSCKSFPDLEQKIT